VPILLTNLPMFIYYEREVLEAATQEMRLKRSQTNETVTREKQNSFS